MTPSKSRNAAGKSSTGTELRAPELNAKQRPLQQRSMETFEQILNITAKLLGEIGVESLSTNNICKAAGITPPALYRYFPNKYAILRELGERLMNRQNELYLNWLNEGKNSSREVTREQAMSRLASLQTAINKMTFEFPAAAWIMRALRAVPALQRVRLDSHRLVADLSFTDLVERFPHVDQDQLRLATRLSTEVMYSATEMVLENPGIDPAKITAEVSEMVVRYYDKFAEVEASFPKHKVSAPRKRAAARSPR